MANEADTCRKYVVPKLQAAGWDNDPHSIAEQRTITDGRTDAINDLMRLFLPCGTNGTTGAAKRGQ